jgi:phage terminase large subunit-like protein
MKSTTSTVAAGTIGYRTLNFLPGQHTDDFRLFNAQMPHGKTAKLLKRSASDFLHTGSVENPKRLNVTGAVLCITAPACVPSIALPNVEVPQDGNVTETTVLSVAKVVRSDVYDITVEGDAPEFYAGSGQILVHNCKWRYPKQSWDAGIMPSLRADLVNDHPRAFVTTTPKPIDLLQEWIKRQDGTVHVIRGSTFDNASNLSSLVISELRKRYDGTMIGRQELYGEIIEGFDGALFSRLDIENNRVDDAPDDIINTVVGVDPSLTGEDDEMGIVVVARTRDNHLWVLADRSIMGVGRSAALEAWRIVAEWGADKLVCEVNLGKRWMQQVFNDAYYELVGQGVFEKGTKPPLLGIDTKIGKKTRGEPVAMRNEQGRLHHVGKFPTLEDQMATFTGWGTNDSPDRLDALVHACRFLMEGEKKAARIASPKDVLSTTLQELWADAGSYRDNF